MNYDLIINIFDEHNEESILLTEKYKPKAVLFLYQKNIEAQTDKLKEYYTTKFPNIAFKSEAIDFLHLNDIQQLLNRYENSNILVNITSGNKIESLILYGSVRLKEIPCEYVDVKNKMLFKFLNGDISIIEDSFVDLNIEEVIQLSGGAIIVDSTEVCNNKAIDKLTNLISNNMTLWNKLKYRLYDPEVFIHDESNPLFIQINTVKLDSDEIKIYNKILLMLKDYEQINYNEQDKIIKVYFLNNYIKGFIFKSGTWLESFTKKVMEEIEPIDDVKSGVLFLWNDEQNRVKNEIDVVAIKDSILICISCKDSNKYDEIALNELNVYAEQLGGDSVVKILVSTKPPLKNSVIQRAKEMNINMVIYEGDRQQFKNNLKSVITKIKYK